MTQHAILSIHAPSVEVWSRDDETFTYGHARSTPLRCGIGDALHFADTREDAEAWRAERLREMGR